jgi:hypothetical protein
MEHIVITIARGFGTGGREIAARIDWESTAMPIGS